MVISNQLSKHCHLYVVYAVVWQWPVTGKCSLGMQCEVQEAQVSWASLARICFLGCVLYPEPKLPLHSSVTTCHFWCLWDLVCPKAWWSGKSCTFSRNTEGLCAFLPSPGITPALLPGLHRCTLQDQRVKLEFIEGYIFCWVFLVERWTFFH